MNISIEYKGHDRGAQAILLDELAATFNEEGIKCKIDSSSHKAGEKGDVATVLVIAGLAVQSIGLLINTLTFYFNRRSTYTVTLKRGNATWTIGNLSEKDAMTIFADTSASESVEVAIIEGK